MVRVPGRAKPAWARSAAIRSRAARWAAVGSMRHTVSDLLAGPCSTVYYCGQFLPGRPDGVTGTWGSRLYRAVAAVVGVAAGGGVRPGGDRGNSPGRQGAGEEPAVGRGQAGRLRDRAGAGGGAGGAAAPLDSGTVHPVRA